MVENDLFLIDESSIASNFTTITNEIIKAYEYQIFDLLMEYFEQPEYSDIVEPYKSKILLEYVRFIVEHMYTEDIKQELLAKIPRIE